MVTKYFLNKITESIYAHSETSAIPLVYYLGLSTTEPNIDGSGVTELNQNTGYNRVAVNNDRTVFQEVDEDGVVSNFITIYFPESILPWNNITHYCIFDEDDNLLIYGKFNATINIPEKAILSIPPNGLKIKADNGTVINNE